MNHVLPQKTRTYILSYIENGTYSHYIKTDPTKRLEHKSVINYDCVNGFLTGKTPDSLPIGQITCENGNWDQPPLMCYARGIFPLVFIPINKTIL